jgi:hypothetical protein
VDSGDLNQWGGLAGETERQAEENVTPIERLDFDAAALMREHPPVWRDPNKRAVYETSCPPGSVHHGRIGFTRWGAMSLPVDVGPARTDVVLSRPGFFDYAPVLDPAEAVEWHVNFAAPHLFVAYGGPLFAQDEIQVAEHPALGALKEALAAAGVQSTTLDHDGPTPVLVTGVERRMSIRTGPDAAAGRPNGLYGNEFALADPEAVRRATSRVDPPTISNLVAMSAPPGGYGVYRQEVIESILTTAYTGFRAAVLESALLRGDGILVVVHTGYWGCGAYGGNRVLMALLQVVAAEMAGLDRLVFHTGGRGGDAPLEKAVDLLRGIESGGRIATRALVEELVGMGFEWGVSDGN